MTKFDQILVDLKSKEIVSGLHTKNEKYLLWKSASKVDHGSIVEIGSFEGYSSIVLAKGVQNGSKVYAIDPHTDRMIEIDEMESPVVGDTWSIFNENIQKTGVSQIVQGIKMKSEDAVMTWKEPIALLYIDGSHRYEDVKKDFLLWKQYVIPGGMVIFHDIWTSGVRRALSEFVLNDREYSQFKFTSCCMFSMIKKTDNRRHLFTIYKFNLAFWLRGRIEKSQKIKGLLLRILQFSK